MGGRRMIISSSKCIREAIERDFVEHPSILLTGCKLQLPRRATLSTAARGVGFLNWLEASTRTCLRHLKAVDAGAAVA